MRASGHANSTLDPVEQERRLMAVGQGSGVGGQVISRWSLLSKLAVAGCLALIAGYLLIWARTVQEHNGPEGYVRITDFVSTLTGAEIIRGGDGSLLYDLDTQRAAQNSVLAPYSTLIGNKILPYNHLPFEALFITPLVGFPYPIAFGLWTLLAGLAIGLSLGLMDGALPVSRPAGWVMSLPAISYLPFVRSLMLGQNSALVLLGLCGTYAALKRGQWGWAGAAMLLVALKPQILPVVLLLLLLQRHWKTLFLFAGLLVGLSVAVMPVLGVGWPAQYAKLLLGVAGWSDPDTISPAIMHNWRGFATNLFGASSPGLVTTLYVALSLASVGLLAWAWVRSRPQAQATPLPAYQPSRDLLWALAGIVAVLTSPHLNPHDLTLLIFPAWIIGAYTVSGVWGEGTSRLWLLILWAGYALMPLTLYLANPTLSVLPSVTLMAVAAVLLARQMAFVRLPAVAPLPRPSEG